MAEIIKIKSSSGEVQYPITKPEAVIDENGKNVLQLIQENGSSYDDTEIKQELTELNESFSELQHNFGEVEAQATSALDISLKNEDKLTELSEEVSGLSERVDNLPTAESSVFKAIYGTTTYEEIKAAYNSGKVVHCDYESFCYVLSRLNEGAVYFETTMMTTNYVIYCNANTNKWSTLNTSLEKSTNKVTTLSESSTDTQYPSAKAVYDFVGKQGVIRQTQTWTKAADNGYNYVMSDIVRGAIPQANMDLFISAGAVFNEDSGYFELNGLTDISYEEMCSIYNAYNPNPWNNQQGMLIVKGVRTCLHSKNDIITATAFTGLRLCYLLEDIEIINMVSDGSPQFNNLQLAWFNNYKLTSIQNIIDVAKTTNFSQTFERCYSLVDVRLRKICASVSFQYSARLSNSSILYMINNEVATSAIVITLHADAYARAMADAEITAALEAHPNVSLASA